MFNTLMETIHSAFADVRRGEGISLHEAIAIDDYHPLAAQQAARAKDTDTHWQDVPCDTIWRCESALSFLDADGFRYYLPAFMCCGLRALEADDGRGNLLIDTCQFHLLHEPQTSLRHAQPANIAGHYEFSAAQCEVISQFLAATTLDDDVPTLEAVTAWRVFADSLNKL
ncbi:MAG: DUF6714 family protein [Deinococcota bacterium]